MKSILFKIIASGIVWLTPLSFAFADDSDDVCTDFVIPEEDTSKAESSYVRRQYDQVIQSLSPYENLFRCLENRERSAELILMLAVAYLQNGNEDRANQLFLKLLKEYEELNPTNIIAIPEAASQRIENIKIEYADELSLNENPKGVTVESVYVVIEKEKRPIWYNLLPFGAGQFQKKQYAWGITYATFQAIGLGLSVAGALGVEFYRGKNNAFTKSAKIIAKRWQIVQFTGIATFGAFYLTSMIHGFASHQSELTNVQAPTVEKPEALQNVGASLTPIPSGLLFTVSSTF